MKTICTSKYAPIRVSDLKISMLSVLQMQCESAWMAKLTHNPISMHPDAANICACICKWQKLHKRMHTDTRVCRSDRKITDIISQLLQLISVSHRININIIKRREKWTVIWCTKGFFVAGMLESLIITSDCNIVSRLHSMCKKDKHLLFHEIFASLFSCQPRKNHWNTLDAEIIILAHLKCIHKKKNHLKMQYISFRTRLYTYSIYSVFCMIVYTTMHILWMNVCKIEQTTTTTVLLKCFCIVLPVHLTCTMSLTIITTNQLHSIQFVDYSLNLNTLFKYMHIYSVYDAEWS